jgi:pimeloyl-ACP methyl ester carboxylesterase
VQLFIATLVCLAYASATAEDGVAGDGVVREEVAFKHGGVTLSGDLLKPEGAGPFPVFIWCHGSGKSNRQWGMEFAKTFVKGGYAFLVWDKPGVGKSSGSSYPQSLSNRAEEVLAAADFLRKRKDINAARVSFCGGSQAGFVLPRVIREFPKAEKLVLIGPGSWSFSEERAYQRQTVPLQKYASLAGISDSQQVDEFLAMYGKVYRAADADFVASYIAFHRDAKGKAWYAKAQLLVPPPPAKPDEFADFQRLFQEGFAFDAVKEYSGIRCPTLILFGEKDECVDPKTGIANIRAGFKASGNTNLEVIVYPNGTHSLAGAGDKPKRDLAEWLAEKRG